MCVGAQGHPEVGRGHRAGGRTAAQATRRHRGCSRASARSPCPRTRGGAAARRLSVELVADQMADRCVSVAGAQDRCPDELPERIVVRHGDLIEPARSNDAPPGTPDGRRPARDQGRRTKAGGALASGMAQEWPAKHTREPPPVLGPSNRWSQPTGIGPNKSSIAEPTL